MSKLLDVLFKIVSVALIFVAPIVYLLWKYSKTNTQVVEVTTNSMPIFVVILISILSIGLIFWIFSQTMALIKDNPFGYGSILFAGALMGVTALLGMLWLDKIIDLINHNVEAFTTDLTVYKGSTKVVLLYIISGLLIGTTGIIIKKTR